MLHTYPGMILSDAMYVRDNEEPPITKTKVFFYMFVFVASPQITGNIKASITVCEVIAKSLMEIF